MQSFLGELRTSRVTGPSVFPCQVERAVRAESDQREGTHERGVPFIISYIETAPGVRLLRRPR